MQLNSAAGAGEPTLRNAETLPFRIGFVNLLVALNSNRHVGLGFREDTERVSLILCTSSQ
jgi:hypothetical protein